VWEQNDTVLIFLQAVNIKILYFVHKYQTITIIPRQFYDDFFRKKNHAILTKMENYAKKHALFLKELQGDASGSLDVAMLPAFGTCAQTVPAFVEICSQFNLGKIVTRRFRILMRTDVGEDIFHLAEASKTRRFGRMS